MRIVLLGLLLAGSLIWLFPADLADRPGTSAETRLDRPIQMGALPEAGGVRFRVWAPYAREVKVEGNFPGSPAALASEGGGKWTVLVPGAKVGDTYQYRITGYFGQNLEKMDPYARHVQHSVGWCYVYDPDAFVWHDAGFAPPERDRMVIYEMHVGTFSGRNDGSAKHPADFWAAVDKVPHLAELGVNMVEVLPVGEFPGNLSWGYSPSLMFATESSYGGPDAFKAFVDACHQAGIGVILDVVHNHYGPTDLDMWQFDGWYNTSSSYKGGIYFYNDYRAGTPWGDTRPDYSRPEVRQFITDNAVYWITEFHLDGLRWDATLYIRQKDGQDLMDGWNMLRSINDHIDANYPNAFMIAEDMQSYDQVTAPTVSSPWAMGFDSQWHAWFMHDIRDTLTLANDSARDMAKVRNAIQVLFQNDATHLVVYTDSHDEDGHLNGNRRLCSEIDPASGVSYTARKRSTLGAGIVFTAPGVPMLFMGQEIQMDGTWHDTDGTGGTPDGRVNWAYKSQYRGIFEEYCDLVALRKAMPALRSSRINVFQVDNTNKVLAWHRWQQGGGADDAVVIANFKNATLPAQKVGLPVGGKWVCVFHGDSRLYAEDFQDAEGKAVTAAAAPHNGLPFSANFLLSPYSLQIYVPAEAWRPWLPYGDLNLDGVVDAVDLALMSGLFGELHTTVLDDRWLDLDESGAFDLADVVILNLYLSEVIGGLPYRGQ